jgi:hypothetical protein
MGTVADGYYFMFEIGWFLDLLIPTLVRVRGGKLYLVGSKPSAQKDLKPCCIPTGGAAECKELALDDPVLRAFKSTESLVLLTNPGAIERELELNLENPAIQERYFNSKAKKQREATVERLMNDYRVLAKLEL